MFAKSKREVHSDRTPLAGCAKLLLVAISVLPLLAGCQAVRPRAATQADIPSDTNAELVVYISDQPYVTAEAACRAVYILANNEIFDGDYDALKAAMRSNGLVSHTWDRPADVYLDRAGASYLVARACQIRTGLNWRLFGLGRYAHRELIYRKIAHPSGEYGLVSGGEFLGVLARGEEYLRELGGAPGSAVELGPEPAK